MSASVTSVGSVLQSNRSGRSISCCIAALLRVSAICSSRSFDPRCARDRAGLFQPSRPTVLRLSCYNQQFSLPRRRHCCTVLRLPEYGPPVPAQYGGCTAAALLLSSSSTSTLQPGSLCACLGTVSAITDYTAHTASVYAHPQPATATPIHNPTRSGLSLPFITSIPSFSFVHVLLAPD